MTRIAHNSDLGAALIERASAPFERRARADARRHIATDIPDPAVFARYLSEAEFNALATARCRLSIWRVDPDLAATLRPSGLCECGGDALTNFGVAVLRALQEDGEA